MNIKYLILKKLVPKVTPKVTLPCHYLFICLFIWNSYTSCCQAQTIVWQDKVGHPQHYSNGMEQYYEHLDGMATFPNHFVAAFDGYRYLYSPLTGHEQFQSYLRYYTYNGILIREDTIGGMVSDARVEKLTDSTFLLRVNYTYISPTESPYDTGQMGGYLLRECTSTGRILWQQVMRENTRSHSSYLYARGNGSFAMYSSINMDNSGNDSLAFEYYQGPGLLERVVPASRFPSGRIGLFTFTKNPERLLAIRHRQMPSHANQWLYTVLNLDSALRTRREDTIGYFPRSYGNDRIYPQTNGRYIAFLPQEFDTLRNRFYFFDGPGWPTHSVLIDSCGVGNIISLADGGALTVTSKLTTNVLRRLDSLARRGLPTLVWVKFQRLDANWQPVWSVDVSDGSTDSIINTYTPVASIPSSPDDAIFYGTRVVASRVRSEPWGTFALVGRINGVGQLYNPLSLKQKAGPRAEENLSLTAFPNPTHGEITVKGLKDGEARLYSMQGRVVARYAAHRGHALRVDMAGFVPGLYVLRQGAMVQRVVRR